LERALDLVLHQLLNAEGDASARRELDRVGEDCHLSSVRVQVERGRRGRTIGDDLPQPQTIAHERPCVRYTRYLDVESNSLLASVDGEEFGIRYCFVEVKGSLLERQLPCLDFPVVL
jgi:hypothetical protein